MNNDAESREKSAEGRGTPFKQGVISTRERRERGRDTQVTEPGRPDTQILAEISDDLQATQTLDLGRVFIDELTPSGSFDLRGSIWSTSFGKVIQVLPIPALLINKSHKIWIVNEAWKRLSPDYRQLRGARFSDLIPDRAAKERTAQALDNVFNGRRPHVIEVILRLAHGYVYARITLRSIRVGKDRFVLLLLEDLTAEKVQLEENRRLREELERRVAERTAELQRTNEELRRKILELRRTQEALEASENRYRTVVEDQTEMIYRFLPDGSLVFVNPACASMLGRSPEELVRWNVFDGMPSDYVRKLQSMLSDVNAKDPTAEFEHLLPNASGEHRWTRWTTRAIRDEHGNVAAIQCVGRDITERKAAAEALRKSEELLRAIFESTRDLILVKDRDLRIIRWNPAVEEVLGLDASQLSGRRADDIFDRKTAANMLDLDRRVLRGEVVEVETTRPYLGEPLTFLEVRSPLLDSQGDIIGVCMIARDITSRKNVGASRVAKADRFPSPAMQVTMKRARIAANTEATILLQGESGSGKDFLARWIHDHSSRASFSYLAINCAALPPDLAESELFGHERGAFTGAVTSKRGLLELAEGGTLLLNEIGELSLSLQAKLLTFLDTWSFRRVGGSREIHVDARLIAATHRDLGEEIAAGRFLEPLYYRLNVLRIEIPPLRKRLEDLPILVDRLYAELTSKMLPSDVPEIDMSSIANLLDYSWPGNVRELKNVLERALMLAQGNRVVLRPPVNEVSRNGLALATMQGETLSAAVEKLTKFMCEEALRVSGGNRKQAAECLGISRGAFYRYLEKFGLDN